VTSSVSGKRSPAELIALGEKFGGGDGNRTRVHGFAGRCLTTRPLHRWIDASCTFERMTGFEPATPTLARLCATNCATSACNERDRRPVRRKTIVHETGRAQISRRVVALGYRTTWHLLATACSVLVFSLVRLSAPVPWLSGRASASHAEGRWFDPSRDHKLFMPGSLPDLFARWVIQAMPVPGNNFAGPPNDSDPGR
jgi:hypothetical protein